MKETYFDGLFRHKDLGDPIRRTPGFGTFRLFPPPAGYERSSSHETLWQARIKIGISGLSRVTPHVHPRGDSNRPQPPRFDGVSAVRETAVIRFSPWSGVSESRGTSVINTEHLFHTVTFYPNGQHEIGTFQTSSKAPEQGRYGILRLPPSL